jgi:hypothetical protein
MSRSTRKEGRKRVRYRRYRTPLETLLAPHRPAQYLREGLSINGSEKGRRSHQRRMQQAKAKLFDQLRLTV